MVVYLGLERRVKEGTMKENRADKNIKMIQLIIITITMLTSYSLCVMCHLIFITIQ